ncbi:MAG: Hint domain-containing protein [Sulfitobacter sp.]
MPLYTLGYVYQLSDFSTSGGNIAPPNERGAQAQGTPPFQMILNGGASPLQIVIDDDDPNFNETTGSDASQPLANAVTIDGVTYPAGSHVVINYVLTDDNGFEGFSITIGQTNSGTNTTTAFITNQPMVPGQTYTFTSEGNIGGNAGARPYSEFACFTAGTLIETPDGPRRIDSLQPGDLVLTFENGPQPVRWVGRRSVPGISTMAPVVIRAGTLGTDQDLAVSPNHRILVEGATTQLLTGHDILLVAAKHLVNGKTILRQPCGFITYVHLMFDDHQIITAQGCLSESYFYDARSRTALDSQQAAELLFLFPDISDPSGTLPKLCHPEAKQFEASLLALSMAA